MDEGGAGSGAACCVGAGTDDGAETGGAGKTMATGLGVAGGGGGTCGFENWPVTVGSTGIFGRDCVEIDGMGETGARIGGGLVVAAGRGGSEVVMVIEADVGVVTCAGLVAIVVDDIGGTSRICAVVTGLTFPVPGETSVAGVGVSPWSSSFLSSRMSRSRLTAAIL